MNWNQMWAGYFVILLIMGGDMEDILRMIIEDNELREMLADVFNYRGHRDLCYEKINNLADRVYEKTGMDLYQYT